MRIAVVVELGKKRQGVTGYLGIIPLISLYCFGNKKKKEKLNNNNVSVKDITFIRSTHTFR